MKLLVLLILLLPIISYSQTESKVIRTPYLLRKNTINIDKEIDITSLKPIFDYPNYRITNLNINTPVAEENGLWRFVSFKKPDELGVIFDSCSFGVLASSIYPKSNVPKFTRNLIIKNSDIRLLTLADQINENHILSSNISSLHLNTIDNSSIFLINCTVVNSLTLNNSRNIKINLDKIKFSDNTLAAFENSTINEFVFINNISDQTFIFINDTINGIFNSYTPEPNNREPENDIIKSETITTLTFDHCFINSTFNIDNTESSFSLEFNNCNFGPDADLRNLGVEEITFNSCRFPDKQIPLSFDPTLKINLNLQNTEIDNLSFNYSKNINLYDSTWETSDDQANYTYQILLSKFRIEGKKESYKYVDLEYRQYNDSSIWNLINSLWWYYGYKPSRVFIWTLLFIFIFYVFNWLNWKEMQEAYPIIEQSTKKSLALKQTSTISTVFLYTIFIFFSLKVNLEKLSFIKHRYVYAFLIQYLTGLWCLLFIIKFVFGI